MDKNKQKKPWYKKWWVWVIVVLLLIGISGANSNKQDSTQQAAKESKTAESTPTPQPTEKAPEQKTEETVTPLGTYAKDKDFEFKVNKVSCGEKRVGGEYLYADARGHYCRINISIKNVSNKAQSIFATSHQKVFDAQNREFEHDTTATLYASDNVRWYDRLNPGIETNGDLVFDVPKDADLTRLEIKEGLFSNKLKLSLK